MKTDIEEGLSVYMDMLRFLAAFAVVMSHVWRLVFPTFPLPWPGHAAVIVFFVISGYVIAFATDRPGQTAGRYTLHRSVRILSVAIPALFLAICIAPVSGTWQVPLAGPIPFPPGDFWHAIWINLVFLGESSWFGRVLPPFNPPYWSLSYEVWYYAIFGIWTFSPSRWRTATTIAVVAFAGLKIALLFPIWIMGVAVYRSRFKLDPELALRLFVLTSLFAFAFYWFDFSVKIRAQLTLAFPNFMMDLHGSDQFLGDYILGAIVAANFVAARSMKQYLAGIVRFRSKIRYLASFTLSIYLLHMPLTVLIWSGMGVHSAIGYAALLVTGIFLAGSLTERQNGRLRALLERKLAQRGRSGLSSTRPDA